MRNGPARCHSKTSVNETLMLPLGDLFSSLPAGTWVDIGCAVTALFSLGLGSRRGLSAEMPLGVGWFCGILSAWHAYAPIHTFLLDWSFLDGEPEFLLFLVFAAVALLAWGVAVLVSRGLRLLAAHVEKTPADYALGMVVGLIRAILILLIVTAIMRGQSWWSSGRDVFCNQSVTGKIFSPWAACLLETLKKFNPHFEVRRRGDEAGDIGNSFGTTPAAPPR